MNRISKSLKAKQIYKDAGVDFDFALPQCWLDKVSEYATPDPEWDYDKIKDSFVWQYPVGCLFGKPGPLTDEAEAWLKTLPEDYQ